MLDVLPFEGRVLTHLSGLKGELVVVLDVLAVEGRVLNQPGVET